MDRYLICGTNWLGDSIMSMPALEAVKRQSPDLNLTVLVKPALMTLWEMHDAVDAVLPVAPGHAGTVSTAHQLRQKTFDRAVLFPNSFRSALIPFLGGVRRRVGAVAHGRRLLLTDPRPARCADDATHQAWEYFRLLDLDVGDGVPAAPLLRPSAEACEQAARLLGGGDGQSWVGMLPGAARGDSKRWPQECFAAVARQVVDQYGVQIALFGTGAESAACEAIASALGTAACNLAGRTPLPVLTAALARCRLVVSNDSGGMHLATASGVPVVAVFGLTDPALTGPLGGASRVICGAPPEQRTRDVARISADAAAALRRVSPDSVFAEVCPLLERA